MRTVNLRGSSLACAGIALAALIALLLAGSRGYATRVYSLEAPNQTEVALIRTPGRTLCQGPITSPAPFRQVAIWGQSVVGTARVNVTVRDARTGIPLSTGQLTATTTPGEWTARLRHEVGARPIRVCLSGALNTFSLEGSQPVDPHVVLTGRPPGAQFSLALVSAGHRALFGSLSSAFSRASLFRPSWVGAWTFWVLLVAVALTFGGGVVAVISAASADESLREDADGRVNDR